MNGQQVVLAKGVELDIAKQHDFVIVLVKDRFEMALGIVLQSRHQLAIGAGDTVGCFEKSLAVRVFADGDQDFANGPLDPRDIDLRIRQRRGMRVARVVEMVLGIEWVAAARVGHDSSPQSSKRRDKGSIVGVTGHTEKMKGDKDTCLRLRADHALRALGSATPITMAETLAGPASRTTRAIARNVAPLV